MFCNKRPRNKEQKGHGQCGHRVTSILKGKNRGHQGQSDSGEKGTKAILVNYIICLFIATGQKYDAFLESHSPFLHLCRYYVNLYQ